jgi:subtilisin family serine protease
MRSTEWRRIVSALSSYAPNVDCLDLVGLSPLMARTSGRPEIAIGLIDGPVVLNHPNLATGNIRQISYACPGNNIGLAHGTFIASVLIAPRGSLAPAICPGCRLLVRPIFVEAVHQGEPMLGARVEELAKAIGEVVDAGARVINLSLSLQGWTTAENALDQALDHALRRGVLVIAAAGNEGGLCSSKMTRHAWTIPVVAYDHRGRPMGISNFSATTGRRGVGAPGETVVGLGTMGEPVTMGGTSVATAFVAGAAALLWSEFPRASAAEIKSAITQAVPRSKTSIVPPLLNAWASFKTMSQACS